MTVFDRNHPAKALIIERARLTHQSSSKCTFHIRLKLQGDIPHFRSGDSIGIIPQNSIELVSSLLKALKCTGDEKVQDPRKKDTLTLYAYLLERANLDRLTPALATLAGGENLQKASLKEMDPLFFLNAAASKSIPLDKLPACFSPLLPRFYSIASSPLVHPQIIDLTVALLSYQICGEKRQGVASQFLCHQAEINKSPIPYYIQPARNFALPKDLNANLIMVGPGTGIAPFRAFMEERMHLQAPGNHWLFFGEREEKHDFLYQDLWHSLVQKNELRLSTAFSRDAGEKRYVQHAMEKEEKELFKWLEQGAYFYLCGDAKTMAKDVHATLHTIIERQGNFTPEKAKAYVKDLKASNRYLVDVY